MTFGQKIKKLRIDTGLTQKELADKMNVTFQTISKWESDLNEPDIYNIKELSRIFNCSFEYLLGDEGEPTSDLENGAVVVPENNDNSTSDRKIKCHDCGKEIDSDSIVHNIEKISAAGIKEVTPICDECFQKRESEINSRIEELNKSTEVINAKSSKKANKKHNKKTVLIWAIVLSVISFIAMLVVGIIFRQQIGIGWTIGLPFIVGYLFLAEIYCLFTDNWVQEVFF